MTTNQAKHLSPNRAKSRIVVFGNLENHLWQKKQKHAPVLQYSSLWKFGFSLQWSLRSAAASSKVGGGERGSGRRGGGWTEERRDIPGGLERVNTE